MKRLTMARKETYRRETCLTGDRCPCPKCTGRLKVVNTAAIPAAGVRIWYLGCNVCHERPENNKIIVPLKFFPQRGRG